MSDIALAITSVRLFAILRAVFRYLERYYPHTATFRILTHLRVWFFRAIEPLAPARLMRIAAAICWRASSPTSKRWKIFTSAWSFRPSPPSS